MKRYMNDFSTQSENSKFLAKTLNNSLTGAYEVLEIVNDFKLKIYKESEIKIIKNTEDFDSQLDILINILNKIKEDGLLITTKDNQTEIKTFDELIERKIIEIYQDEKDTKYVRVLDKDLEGHLIVPTGIFYRSRYFNNEIGYGLGKLSKITLLDELHPMFEKFFYGCENLEEIVLMNKPIIIPKEAFFNCRKLENLKINTEHIKTIEEKAFTNCEKMSKQLIFENLEKIGKAAFYNCKELDGFEFAKSLEYIDDLAFYNTRLNKDMKDDIKLPQNVKLGKGVFLKIPKIRIHIKKSQIGNILTKEERKIYVIRP